MFPLKDDNPTRRFPVLTVGLILINVVVFFFEMSLGPPQIEALLNRFGVVPARFDEGRLGHAVLTLFTSQFLHGGVLHVGGNMLYLWIFGNNIEDQLGRTGFLFFYLAGGAIAALAQVLSNPQSTVPAVGASGAIAAVLGAYLVLFPKAQVHTLIILFIFIRIVPVPAALWLGIWFAIQVFSAAGSRTQEGGVAWFAHAGGFVFGVLVALLSAPARRRVRSGREFSGSELPWT